jgi:hypothetical protein
MVLNVPQSDATIYAETCQSADVSEWNSVIAADNTMAATHNNQG